MVIQLAADFFGRFIEGFAESSFPGTLHDQESEDPQQKSGNDNQHGFLFRLFYHLIRRILHGFTGIFNVAPGAADCFTG